MSRFSLRRAHRIIALDRFMRDRIAAKGIAPEKIAVVPPWSHDDHVHSDPAGRARFRQAHGLEGKFVVMYSGNHSPEHSLAALLAGSPPFLAREVFGSLHRAALNLPPLNLRCLPYQPLTGLAASLSAADLQVVVMGNAFVGLCIRARFTIS